MSFRSTITWCTGHAQHLRHGGDRGRQDLRSRGASRPVHPIGPQLATAAADAGRDADIIVRTTAATGGARAPSATGLGRAGASGSRRPGRRARVLRDDLRGARLSRHLVHPGPPHDDTTYPISRLSNAVTKSVTICRSAHADGGARARSRQRDLHRRSRERRRELQHERRVHHRRRHAEAPEVRPILSGARRYACSSSRKRCKRETSSTGFRCATSRWPRRARRARCC